MLAEERRSRIQDLIVQKSVVTLAELAALFETSEMTVRRDLDALAARGACHRIRGGAMSLRPPDNRSFAYPSYFSRAQAQARENAASRRPRSPSSRRATPSRWIPARR